MGKIVIVEFLDKEEVLFQQTVEWLFSKLSISPTCIRQSANEFQLDPFSRTFTNCKGQSIYLTA